MDDFHRHVRLPRELLALLAPVPEPEREAVRAAICEALSDAGIQVTGVRTDAIGRGPNYDEWAIPTGQLASLKEKLFDVITQYIAGALIVPAPPGEGWNVDDLVSRLPGNAQLSASDVQTILTELRGLLDVQGNTPSWKVQEREGRFWSQGV